MPWLCVSFDTVAAEIDGLSDQLAGVGAVDYDPQALLATRANAAYNDVPDDRLSVTDTLPAVGCCDLVVANILANPLVDLAGRLYALLKTEGAVILSGILDAQLDTVLAAYPELKFAPARRREGWICVEGTRRSG